MQGGDVRLMVKAGKELPPQPADELHRAHREPLEGPQEQRQLRVVFGKALVLLLQSLRAEDYQDYQSVTLRYWIAMAVESGVGELARFARGLIAVKEQILNFCEHRMSIHSKQRRPSL